MAVLPQPRHVAYAAPVVPLSYLALLLVGLLYVFGYRKYSRPIAISLYYLVIPAGLWVWQFELWQRGLAGWVYIVNAIQVVAVGTAYLGWVAVRKGFRPGYATLIAVYLLSQLLQFFSYIYWSYGTPRNFNAVLSHLDSLYIAAGTLTTAGTGRFLATSELATRLQLVQMGLDFALIAVAVALLFLRFSIHLANRERGPISVGPSRTDSAVRRKSSLSKFTYRQRPW